MAAEFDGTDDRIDLNFSDSFSQITLMCWIRADAFNNDRIYIKNNEKDILLIATNRFRFAHFFSIDNGQWNAPNNSLPTGTDHHIAVTYDNTSVANDPVMYVDGASVAVSEGRTPAGTANANANNHFISDLVAGTNVLDGIVYDFRIYNRILSAAEIQTIHAARGTDGIIQGLEAAYFLNEQSPGTTLAGAASVIDRSSNAHHGTPAGNPVYREEFTGLRYRRSA